MGADQGTFVISFSATSIARPMSVGRAFPARACQELTIKFLSSATVLVPLTAWNRQDMALCSSMPLTLRCILMLALTDCLSLKPKYRPMPAERVAPV